MVRVGNFIVIAAFVFFVAVYIQIPGLLMLRSERVDLETTLLAFFAGMGVLILEFFLCSALKLQIAFVVLSPILTVSLLAMPRNRKKASETVRNTRIDGKFVIILAAVSLVVYIVQHYCIYDLEKQVYFSLFQDINWHIGNVASLGRGVPFADYRIADIPFFYHYFNDLIFGMCKYAFDISAYALIIKCSPLLTAYVYSLGIYAFFRKITAKPILGFTLFTLSGGALPYFILNADAKYSMLNYHIYSNVNGVATALAAVIAAYLYYLYLVDKKEKDFADIIIFMIIIFALTGSKGPFAAVMIAAFLATDLLITLKNRSIKHMIPSVAGTFSFLCTYFFVIKGISNISKESNNNRAIALSISDTFSRSRLGEAAGRLLDNGNIGSMIIYCLLVFLIGSLISAGLLFLLFLIRTVIVTRDVLHGSSESFPADSVVAVISGWTGLAGFWLVSQEGFSQTYFLFVALLFISAEAVLLLESNMNNTVHMTLYAAVIINTVICAYWHIGALVDSLNGENPLFFANSAEETRSMTSTLSGKEMEGLIWLRDNTDTDAVIATDRHHMNKYDDVTQADDNTYFYDSAFAERQMYIEGTAYSDVAPMEITEKESINNDIYCNDKSTSEKAIKRSGVDYIIVSKRFCDSQYTFSNPVFANEDILIFKAGANN